ncbi:translocase of inner membrane 10 [Dermatophagoides pteronyssinus]|uniref:translocase of inner membrane 10 n=1 Tax=Dermatophagoides pteronyssinus TaxID=6956 RepID=UPI003F667645
MAAPQFNLDPSKMQIINELEVEMVADMYNRMTRACRLKCIVRKYKDSELSKGESVCIDRCVAKYLDIHDKIGKKLNSLSHMDEEAAKKLQQEQQQLLQQQQMQTK